MRMSANTVLREAAPAETIEADEPLYRSERTVVVRRRLPGSGGHVVIKQAIGAEAARRLRKEAAILARLGAVDSVVRLAADAAPPGMLALQDDGGVPLSSLLKTRSLGLIEAVGLARALARTLAGVHRAGVIHKDINPSNILVGSPPYRPTLIDFNLASSAAEERPGFTHQSHIAGTPAYMSPEQTGRTGRPVDLRTDLYSLGATLYELATGRKPFESTDLLELVHDHLVRMPVAPALVDARIPPLLSSLVMRLLEKEPDRRYQSAEGLEADLARIQGAMLGGDSTPFVLGQQDFASRLMPPSRLIGRETELGVLERAVCGAVEGRTSCLLVAGAPGVGKTALINELRPLVTARRGWFVSAKFDQYRHDAPTVALEPIRALGRLLLAEPEERLAAHRARMLRGMGSNLGFGPALLPEFVLLLGSQPGVEVTDPREAEARMVQATLDLLRSVVSVERPLILVYDDLQWAPPISLRILDAVVAAGERLPGLLVVGAYRANDIDATHPLGTLLARWSALGMAPPSLRLDNLRPADTATLIGELLRIGSADAGTLASALDERTDGNPYDTVELINALRQDGLLVPRDGRWEWEAQAIRHYAGDASVVDLLGRRIAKLPQETQALLQAMACLGGEVHPALLGLASGSGAQLLLRDLAPALEDGLLVTEQGERTRLGFRHDRVQQAVFERMAPAQRSHRHLALARRLAAHPEFEPIAAEQFLHAGDGLADEAERRQVVRLFQEAAQRLGVLNYAVAERFLGAALGLLRAVQAPGDNGLLQALEAQRHSALCGLGRLQEADAVYASIVARGIEPMELVGPACVQMDSLANRGQYPESVNLGLALLAELGGRPKPPDLRAAMAEGFQRLAQWEGSGDMQADFERPVVSDPRVLAWARVIIKTANAAYFVDPACGRWLVAEAHRLWLEHGPCAQLMPSVSCLPYLLAGKPQSYRAAYKVSRHMLAVGEARAFEPGTSFARYVFAHVAGHWVEPIEHCIEAYRRVHADMMREGDFTFACYAFQAVDHLLDSAPTLDLTAAEVEAGLAFAARTGNAAYAQRYRLHREAILALLGEAQVQGGDGPGDGPGNDGSGFDEAACVASLGAPGTATYHVVQSISAAIFGDLPALERHSAHAMPLLQHLPGFYITANAYVLRAVALAEQARRLPQEDRAPVLQALDSGCLAWLALRAADAPVNFLHLLRWVEAERAWAAGQVWAAGAAFDTALQEAAQRMRPWHRALITERAALFHLAQGMERSGHALLMQACGHYEAWGAAGKVRELRRTHVFLRGTTSLRAAEAGACSSASVATDVVDLMAVLRASQALSSETSLSRLTERVSKVLSAMTGATHVQLLVRPGESDGWVTAASLDPDAAPVSVEEAGASGLLALSVFRYVERTGETLVLDDATRDDRFASDPHVAPLDQCSMLLAPILKHGRLHAMLVLESRHLRAAFSGDRLDAVTLISGQLSASLDNALLYASLERKVAERTAALEQANERLEQLSWTDALTGLANRRRFNETLEAEWQRASRTRQLIGLVVVDVDHFKLYNDHYGHLRGDACLQRVAQALVTGRRRGSDLVARYGGEEFVMLLPCTDGEGTLQVADRMRAAVEALAEPHARSAFGLVTISVGIAAMVPTRDIRPTDLIAAADAALYEAKHAGRNRVAWHRTLAG